MMILVLLGYLYENGIDKFVGDFEECYRKCVERQKIKYKGHICLDVETRWNSTYLMLDVALKRKMAFAELEFYDTSFNLWLYYFFLFNLVPIFVIFVQFSPYIRYFCLI